MAHFLANPVQIIKPGQSVRMEELFPNPFHFQAVVPGVNDVRHAHAIPNVGQTSSANDAKNKPGVILQVIDQLPGIWSQVSLFRTREYRG